MFRFRVFRFSVFRLVIGPNCNVELNKSKGGAKVTILNLARDTASVTAYSVQCEKLAGRVWRRLEIQVIKFHFATFW